MKNYKAYTPEEVMAALKELDSQYLSPEMFVLIHGIPQLVEKLQECETAFHAATDSREACHCVDADGVMRPFPSS
jgi:hypothetical protein